jgi:hypothetical protein
MMVQKVCLLLAMTGALALTGCQGQNLSPQPGPHIELDTLRPTADFYARVDKPLENSGSSLAGMSRDNWNATTFSVPISGVEHKPTSTTDKPHIADTSARQRGEYPTQRSVTEGQDTSSSGDQAAEAALGPVRAAWDIIWMVPKMVVTPPDRKVSSPRDGYERRPHATIANNGGLKDGGLGVALKPLSPTSAPPATTPAGEPLPPADPNATPAPSTVLPPQPPLPPPGIPTTEPAPAPAPTPGVSGGAIGGGDSHKRREQNKPKEQKP